MTGSQFMDDFAERHLLAWFKAGGAPYDWDLSDLERFKAWVIAQDDVSETISWPELVRAYELSAAQ